MTIKNKISNLVSARTLWVFNKYSIQTLYYKVTFYSILGTSVHETIKDENLTFYDSKIATLKHDKFPGGFVIVSGLIGDFEACYASYLEGRKGFEKETNRLMKKIAAIKPLNSTCARKLTKLITLSI